MLLDQVNFNQPPYGQLLEKATSTGSSIEWVNGTAHTKMLQLDGVTSSIRIFPRQPRTGGANGLQAQYEQVTELQLDRSSFGRELGLDVTEGDDGFPELHGLPDGFGRRFDYGLGFPRAYRAFIREIEKHTSCTCVRFSDKGSEGASGTIFTVRLSRFHNYMAAVKRNAGRAANVERRVNEAEVRNILAEATGAKPVDVVMGRKPIIRLMTRGVTESTALDAEQRVDLVKEMRAQSRAAATEDPSGFGKLRAGIELVSLETLLQQFKAGLNGQIANKEEKWQTFFETNSFALQQLFAAPVVFYGSQVQVRVPSASGSGGRVADFVLLNPVTRSAVIVEIKTPATKLMSSKPYRGRDGAEVHVPHKELAGATAQIHGQIESARADLQQILAHTPGASSLDTRLVRGAIVAGNVSTLQTEEKDSFLRYRDGLAGIDILGFDEVLARLEGLHSFLDNPKSTP